MDRKYIGDHHIVARYLADQLPSAEREAFEAYYLEHPEMVQEIEAAARFKIGLTQLRDSGELDVMLRPQSWYRQPRYVAAALAALALGIGYFASRSPEAQPLLAPAADTLRNWRGTPLTVAGTHAILRTRSGSYDAEIDLPASPQVIELQVLPEFQAQPPRYRVSLSKIAADDSTLRAAQVRGLTPADDGFVAVYLNGARIEQGRYQLVISGDEGTSAADERSAFVIRIRDVQSGSQTSN